MIDFNDYENAGYVVLQQVLPEFEEAYSVVSSYTDAELEYLKQAIWSGSEVNLDNIRQVLDREIQYDIIWIILKHNFSKIEDFEEFEDKYMDEISEWVSEITFISRDNNDSIYIQKSDNFVEEFLQYLDSDDEYDTCPINWYEVVNELNRDTQLKFII